MIITLNHKIMKRKGCGPQGLGSPFKQTGKAENMYKKQNKTVAPATNKTDNNKDTFTPTYNAATGMTTEQDPSYKYERRESYKRNAIKNYGSLQKSRDAYKKYRN